MRADPCGAWVLSPGRKGRSRRQRSRPGTDRGESGGKGAAGGPAGANPCRSGAPQNMALCPLRFFRGHALRFMPCALRQRAERVPPGAPGKKGPLTEPPPPTTERNRRDEPRHRRSPERNPEPEPQSERRRRPGAGATTAPTRPRGGGRRDRRRAGTEGENHQHAPGEERAHKRRRAPGERPTAGTEPTGGDREHGSPGERRTNHGIHPRGAPHGDRNARRDRRTRPPGRDAKRAPGNPGAREPHHRSAGEKPGEVTAHGTPPAPKPARTPGPTPGEHAPERRDGTAPTRAPDPMTAWPGTEGEMGETTANREPATPTTLPGRAEPRGTPRNAQTPPPPQGTPPPA